MTYTAIFKEIYYNNRKFIRTYLTICLVFSMLAFGNGGVSQAGSDITSTEAISTLGGEFGALIAPLAESYLAGIDLSSAFLIFSAISLSFDYIPAEAMATVGDAIGVDGLEGLINFSFGILDYNVVRILCLLWFILDKVAKSNRVTYSTGVILEEYEAKIGAVVLFLVTASQYLSNIPLSNTVQAATDSIQPLTVATRGFNALICFMLLMGVMVVYALIRCLFFFIDIIIMPTCTITPFAGLIIEMVKTLSIVGLMCLAVAHPYVFCVIFLITLAIAIKMFRTTYITIRYFKHIYVKPFFRKFRGYDREIPLVAPRAPKKVKQFTAQGATDILLPVYTLKKVSGEKGMRRYDRWWFVSTPERKYLCKPYCFKNTCRCIELKNSEEHKIFIKKSFRFFEIFGLKDNTETIAQPFHPTHKQLYFVFSKEYYHRFETIKELTQFTDYTEYKNQIKEQLKLIQKENKLAKRQARLEAKEERRIARQNKKLLNNQNE